jgi:hypothetical protein
MNRNSVQRYFLSLFYFLDFIPAVVGLSVVVKGWGDIGVSGYRVKVVVGIRWYRGIGVRVWMVVECLTDAETNIYLQL